jgi:hypothetical protein
LHYAKTVSITSYAIDQILINLIIIFNAPENEKEAGSYADHVSV